MKNDGFDQKFGWGKVGSALLCYVFVDLLGAAIFEKKSLGFWAINHKTKGEIIH